MLWFEGWAIRLRFVWDGRFWRVVLACVFELVGFRRRFAVCGLCVWTEDLRWVDMCGLACTADLIVRGFGDVTVLFYACTFLWWGFEFGLVYVMLLTGFCVVETVWDPVVRESLIWIVSFCLIVDDRFLDWFLCVKKCWKVAGWCIELCLCCWSWILIRGNFAGLGVVKFRPPFSVWSSLYL